MLINAGGQAIYGACPRTVHPFLALGAMTIKSGLFLERTPIVVETPKGNLAPSPMAAGV